MDANANAIQSTSLFRPEPLNKLQSNLASHYERTSQYVDKQFQEMAEPTETTTQKLLKSKSESEDSIPRLNPIGLGQVVDLYI